MVITYFDRTLENCLESDHEILLSVKFNLSINFDLEYMLSCLKKNGIHPEISLMDGFERQEIIFDGIELAGTGVDFEKIAEYSIPQYEDFFTYSPNWGSGVEGVVQLFLLFMISNKMRWGNLP